MTVNEMIKELVNIQKNGHGDAEIMVDIISDWGDEETHDCEYNKKNNTVRIF